MSPFQPTVVRGFSKYTRINDAEVGGVLVGGALEPSRVVDAARIVDRARPTTMTKRSSRASRTGRRPRGRGSPFRAALGERQLFEEYAGGSSGRKLSMPEIARSLGHGAT